MTGIAVNRIFLFIIFFCISIDAIGSNQSSNYPSDFSLLNRVLLLDASNRNGTRILVGEHGLIYISRNNQPWLKKELPDNVMLTGVYMYDNNLAWVTGHDATIYRTVNGGDSWQKVHSGARDASPLLDIWFQDDKIGIAIGAYGQYLVTRDGGKSWSPKKMQIDTANKIISHAKQNSDELTDTYDLHLNAITQSGNGKLYIVAEAGRIYRSGNLGETWQELPSPYSGSFFGILALEKDNLLVFGLRGHMYHSADAGLHWVKIDTNTRELLTGGTIFNDKKIVVVGMNGIVLTSSDHGRSFSQIRSGNRHNFSAVIENGNDEIIVIGEYGMEIISRKKLGISDE